MCSFLYEIEKLTGNKHNLKFHQKVSYQIRFTLEPSVLSEMDWSIYLANLANLAYVPLLDHTILSPTMGHTSPASHVHSLVMKWAFHMRLKHFGGGGARVLPRRTADVRPRGTSAGLLWGLLPLTISITHSWSCTEYFTKDKHPEHDTSTIKPFPRPASEMSGENFISQRNVY